MDLFRRIAASVTGLVAGAASVGLIEWLSSRVHSMPEGLEIDDAEGMRQWISTLPVSAFLMLLVAWGLGCLVGAYVARRLAPNRSSIPAWIVVGLLTAATAFNLANLPHPTWMWPAGIAVCIVFGAIGLVLASPKCYTVSSSRLIQAPIDKVFRTLADVRQFSEAIPHITSIEFLTEQHYGVGTRFCETRLMNGREAATVLEVTELVENEHVRIVSDAGGAVWDTVFTVDQQAEGVNMTMQMDALPHNPAAKLLTPMILGIVDKAVQQDMDVVKSFCEGQTEAATPEP